jgi:hypothetical protein
MPTMNSTPGFPLRGVLLVASAAACLAVVVWRSPDTGSLPGLGGGTDPEVRRSEELDDLLRRALRCTDERQRLTAAVVEGRLPLLEAAGRFRDLNRDNPGFNWERFRHTYPGVSDDERFCRQVLAHVDLAVRVRPGADPALPGRLEAELRDLLSRGDLHLPGPTPAAPAGP